MRNYVRGVTSVGLGLLLSSCNSFSAAGMPAWKVTLRVLDQNGAAVEDAAASVGYYRSVDPDTGAIRGAGEEGSTDMNGEVTFSARSYKVIYPGVQKEGYYPSRIKDYEFETTRLGRWMPWNPTVEIELKEIRNPIPMYSKSVKIGLPEFDVPLGYDMERGDWISPHGSGRIADFVFTGVLVRHDKRNYDYTLTVQFSNEGDGIIEGGLQAQQASALKSDYLAPENGYLDEWVLYERVPPGEYRETNINHDRIYYYRVRTEKDEDGNVIRANYGKIYGDFLQIIHYFNPDQTRNVEFDPKGNLVPSNEVNVGFGTRSPPP